MKSFVRDHLVLTALVGTMVAVLLILATLQYRWSRQVREANEVRVGENLRSEMMDWHADLLHEFSSIALALQVSLDSGARDHWPNYVQRFAGWKATAPHPALAQDLFIWETSTQTSRLMQVDESSSDLKSAEAESETSMRPLLDRLASRSSNLEEATEAWQLRQPRPAGPSGGASNPGSRADPLSGWQFDASLPALVHPIVHHPLTGDATGNTETERPDWLIVRLNLNTLRDQVLPSLAERHFAGEGGLEYEITVRSGAPEKQVLYTSDSHAVRKEPDVQMKIFGPPPEMGGGRPWMASGGERYLRASEWRHLSAPNWFPVIQYSALQPGWELLLSHREGSLESALEAIRRRNLFLSYGILVLLAASMSLILLASQRAHRLARLQMDFVATVSHELRTPLAVIQSAAENIRDGVIGGSEQVNRYGQVIRNQTRQLSDLVEQILSFAAARDGKLRYRMEELSVPEVMKIALGNTEDMIRQAGFTLEVAIPDDLPGVLGDQLAIAQCLQNLIINAVKYGGEQRWLRVEATQGSSISGVPEVQIRVSDRGLGIRESELGQIFDPFYRSTAVHEAQIHGTGLGLPLARSIAEAMNGRLSVVSEVGLGSTFTLHLPGLDQRKMKASSSTVAPAPIHHE